MHQEFESPEELRDAIPCFWYFRKDFGEQRTAFEVMPDGYTEIIFHFGGSCSMLAGDSYQELPSPFMMGLLNQPAVFYATNCLEIIGIRCYPWTVFDLLGLSSKKGGVRTFGHPVAQLQPALASLMEEGRVEDAIALVKHYFLDARSHVPVGSLLNKAGAAMRKANGTLPVKQVAAAAHSTVRTLERNFKQSSGRTVKDVSGLIRFEKVRNHLWLHPEVSLAALAQDMGYADQSHMSREFKRYSGFSPAAFVRKARAEKRYMNTDRMEFGEE